MRRKFRLSNLTTLLYAACVVLFFLQGAVLPYKVAYPVLLLAVSVFLLRRKELVPLGAALSASAVGDAMGAEGRFIPQMLFFAVAHLAYIFYFLSRESAAAKRSLYPVSAVLLGYLFLIILPEVSDPAERIGTCIYGIVIGAMLYTVLRYRGAYATWFRTAASLFVFSDALLAWNRFVSPVPGRTYWIMLTYYLAQYLFYRFAAKAALIRRV